MSEETSNLSGTMKETKKYLAKAEELATIIQSTGDRALAALYALERKYGNTHSAMHLMKCAVWDIVHQEIKRECAWVRTGNQNHPI